MRSPDDMLFGLGIRIGCLVLAACAGAPVFAQSAGATFGEVIRLGGTPSDIVFDQSRRRLYLVNSSAGRVDFFDCEAKQVMFSVPVGNTPVAAALSFDNRYLYVSNNGSSSLSVIDAESGASLETVALPAKPEGVAVGGDGRALITTEGTSTTDTVNSLVLYDRTLTQGQQVRSIQFGPPPATPSPLPQTIIGRPITTFRGKLLPTPGGNFIIGLSTVNNNAQTVLFVYETASASILRSRTVTGQSTVLSVSPDGSRFMAGFTLYDTETLDVIAQQSASNAPFPLSSTGTATFNTTQNVGGSVFAPDGETLYSAFNVAPFQTPAARPQASTLLISDASNLGIRLGIKVPESIIARMVIAEDASEAWGLSESGLIYLPLARLYDYPILQPDSSVVFLAQDDCQRGLAKATVGMTNLGRGRATFSVPDTTAALVAQATSGVAPSSITFIMESSRSNVTRQYGTNLYTGSATNQGTALAVNLSSPDAINVPNTIRVYMNTRQQDQRGVVYPIPTVPTNTEGLYDILVDEARDRVYIANAGYNRIEVFDRTLHKLLTPIKVGQLPHQMVMAGDGRTLYVANTGGESISIVDLDEGKVTGRVKFPPIPRAGNANPVTPQAIANSFFGLQVVTSNGSQWKVVDGEASVRPTNAIAPTQFNTTAATGPVRMINSFSGRYILTIAGNGTAYLYDGMADTYTNSIRPYSATTIQGFYGPLTASPEGSFYAMNGFILNSSLAVLGGADTPSSTAIGRLTSTRNVAALAALDENRFVRLTTPVKQAIGSAVSGEARPTLEMVNLVENSVVSIGPVAENPPLSVFGNARVNVPPRQIAVDSRGTVYALTLSGLSVIPLTAAGSERPRIAGGVSGVVNANDGTRTFRPGSFVAINGANLASQGVADQAPVPTVLGGSCVTFSNVQLPLLQTSGTQIVAQVPDDLLPGTYVAQVRSLATGQRSDAVLVTVQR